LYFDLQRCETKLSNLPFIRLATVTDQRGKFEGLGVVLDHLSAIESGWEVRREFSWTSIYKHKINEDHVHLLTTYLTSRHTSHLK
jgi:hypothetical protein